MGKMIKYMTLLGFMLLICWGYGQDSLSKSRFLAKVDLLGLATLPSASYLRLSTEFEFQGRTWHKASVIVDFEYYRGSRDVANLNLATLYNTPDYLFGTEIHKEASARIGVRKYFGKSNEPLAGFFAELQSGMSNKVLDSVYPVVDNFPYRSTQLSLEARLRAGYQQNLFRRGSWSFLFEVDPRRFIVREKWYRLVWIELNIGLGSRKN